ncbi:NUDIX domain-containing protein [Candidatus Saccharibacteria bacterium]|nr:NUDIX domain-containing protein [Candidatus Saccharibacteria bacterium]
MSNTERFRLLAAAYIIIRKENKVLLLKRANTGYQDGNYGLPAGHLNGGELATHAAVREAKEEAGVVVRPEDVRLVFTDHRLDTGISPERIELVFEATKWEGEPFNAEPEKCDDLSWYDLGDLPENMIPLVRAILNSIARGEIYAEHASELE